MSDKQTSKFFNAEAYERYMGRWSLSRSTISGYRFSVAKVLRHPNLVGLPSDKQLALRALG